jgi:ERCC4-type nuclease
MGLSAVMIDKLEPAWVQKLTFGCSTVSVQPLDTADIWLYCEDGALLLIERKTPSDLLSTMHEKRLFPQLERMPKVSPWSYLVISGMFLPSRDGKVIIDGHDSDWTWPSIQGCLLTCQEIGVHILQIPDDLHFEAAVTRLGSRDRRPLRVPPAREIALLSEGEVILTSFPGVGEQMATTLLQACGSAAFAIDALTSLSKSTIPGLGPETKRKVRRALGLADDVELVPMVAEQAGKESAA